MASISITWHVLRDGHKICPICLGLDNYTWTFDIGTGSMDSALAHPVYGIVWDMASGSRAHEHPNTYGECRCYVTTALDVKSLVEELRTVRDHLLTLLHEGGYEK